MYMLKTLPVPLLLLVLLIFEITNSRVHAIEITSQQLLSKSDELHNVLINQVNNLSKKQMLEIYNNLDNLIEKVFTGSVETTEIFGFIEDNINFSFDSAHHIDLYAQCILFYKNKFSSPQSIDDVHIGGPNIKPKKYYYYGGYWRGRYELCSKITSVGISYGVPNAIKKYKYSIAGHLEGKYDFAFVSNKLAEIYQSCYEFYDDENIESTIDDIRILQKDGSFKKHYCTGCYWRTKKDLCNKIVDLATKSD